MRGEEESKKVVVKNLSRSTPRQRMELRGQFWRGSCFGSRVLQKLLIRCPPRTTFHPVRFNEPKVFLRLLNTF